MKMFLRSMVIVTVVAFVPCLAAGAEEIRISGGGAAISTILDPIKSPFEKASGISLNITTGTPKLALRDLLEGKLDAAVAALPVSAIVADIEKDGMKVDATSLAHEVIGQNITIIFLHKDNPVSSLTKMQLKGIFTGKTTNWKEVGGPDAPILVVWGLQTPGQNASLVQIILDGDAVTKDILQATNYANVKENVAANPEAIGIGPLGLADASVKVIRPNPPMAKPIYIITKGAPSPKVQKLITFIKGEGQAFIAQ